MKQLTPKEKRVCEEYFIDHSKVNAMRRAGYANKTAERNSGEFFQRPHIEAFIAEIAKELSANKKLTAEAVLEETRRLAFSNLASYYKLDPKGKKLVLKELHELSPEQTAAIMEYEPGKHLKLYAKDNALDKLAKHFKLYTDLEAGVSHFVIMPTLKKNGVEVVFNVGRPAPEPMASKTV